MYNEELEMLIEAALADGELTEKEKQILFRKAQNMGVDLDEFNLILQGRMHKTQAIQKPKESSKRGSVKKCPNCGTVVTDYTATKCPECGYLFDDIVVNSSMQKLTDRIAQIQEKYSCGLGAGDSVIGSIVKSTYGNMDEKRDKEIASAISTFPVSKSKADLLEFISGAMSQIQFSSSVFIKNAWRAKWQECITKAQMFYPNDTDFAPLIQQYNLEQTFWNKLYLRWQSKSKMSKAIIIYIVLAIICGLILCII